MADLIERDAALARIDCCLGNSLGGRKEFDSGLMQARKFVLSTPAVNRWIPCSERLPENCEEVLVWFEYFRYGEYNRLYQTYGIGNYFANHDSWLIDHETGWQKLRVLAWMPLPEPPKE